ncbi:MULTISPECIES: hypothetical protein [unclassified Pseudoalteromonas]|uniref:hypothetical protein n=1 Tax=unclassified Pseudoalteromonas TaxID=194690 RepID=UPI001B39D6B5|nr:MULTISPECIES: hypothetical protein [unclassified Pseudoalteromonas]MBQ4844262.1 hypothetical protein [Pseudoalteromonas sp. MMG005]MBQ4850119.1 hypothetical protein [Pseudoalteromonas sp. MMG012]
MEFLELFRTGELHPIFLVVVGSVIIALPFNLLIAKLKGFRKKPAIISSCIPILNMYVCVGYLLAAIFYQRRDKKSLSEDE